MRAMLQRIDEVLRPGGRVFFGWWIVAASGGIQLFAASLFIQSYGAYLVLLQADFGWSKTVMAGAFALTRLESGLLGPLQGWLVDRIGTRPVILAGALIFGISFMLFSQVQGLVGFYLIFALMALGSSLGGFPTLMVSLVNWFRRHRSKAISLSSLGFSLGGLAVPLVILSMESIGWRSTAFFSGVIILGVTLPLACLIRHRPAELGEVPDGVRRTGRSEPTHLPPMRNFSASEALRTAAFWQLSLGHALALLIVSTMLVHLTPHLTESLEYSLGLAGLVIALVTGFQMTGQVIGGYLGDKIDKRILCAACMVAHSLGVILITYATSAWMVGAFAVLHGLAWGMRGPQMVALRADYFGPASFGTIMGFSSLIVMFGMGGGPIIAGYMADVYGGYEQGFTLLAILGLLGAVFFLLARPPQAPGHDSAASAPASGTTGSLKLSNSA